MIKQPLPALQGFHVVTKFHGPGDSTGSRVSAALKRDSNTTWRVFISWNDRLSAAENHAAAVAKLIARHWPEPAEFTDEHRDWELTVPRIVACCGHDPDTWHWVACGAWQFSCGAAWLTKQREAMGRPFNATMEAVL